MKPHGAHGILTRIARSLARAVVPRAVWPIVEDELEEELSEREGLGWSHWRSDVWAAAQYLSIAARLAVERMIPSPGDGRFAIAPARGGWSLDLKQALRVFRSRPATAVTVATTVALAIGATTTVYSVVDGVLLRPLPYPEPDRLARIWQTTADSKESSKAEYRSPANRLTPLAPSYYDWLGVDTGFESLGAYVDASFVLQQPDGARALRGQEVTSGLFETLGVDPILGRYFQPGDDGAESPPVVLLGEAFWRDRFGSRPDALGTDLVIDGRPHTVVGVMPAGFEAPTMISWDTMLPAGDPLLWTPLSDEARRGWKSVSVVGRLRRGVSIEAASDRLTAVDSDQGLDERQRAYYRGAWAESLVDSVVGSVRSTLWFLLGAVCLALVVATVNIANVLTASALGRRREMAVRVALGAGSTRLVRGLLVESAVMAGLGGLGGILVAWISLPVFLRLLPPTIPRHEVVGMSTGVLLIGIALTAVAALLAGTVPAILAARTNPHDAMRSSARALTSGHASGMARAALVVAEVSLAFVLLVGAALLGNSYLRLWSVEPGFATGGLVAMRVVPDRERYTTEEESDLFAQTLAARLDEVPGVTATAVNNLPLSGQRSGTTFYIERLASEAEAVDDVLLTVMLNNYLDVMGIPIVAGRGFESGDAFDAPPVAIVSETMARRFWPGETVIGQRLRTFDDSTVSIEIVGVAADVKHEGLDAAVAPTVYLPASQSRRDTHEVVIRVRGDIANAVQSARAVVASLSSTTPVTREFILDESIASSVAIPRFRTMLVVGLAVLAAVLALVGLYGVVAFTVAQRTKEVGIRIALGARSRDVVLRVVADGLKLGGAGVAVGFFMAWSVSGVMEAFLFEIAPTDPATYLGVAIGVLVVSTVAVYVPARRAAVVDPVGVLKGE